MEFIIVEVFKVIFIYLRRYRKEFRWVVKLSSNLEVNLRFKVFVLELGIVIFLRNVVICDK